MATEDCSMLPAEAGSEPRLRAAGYVLSELASTLGTALELTYDATQDDQPAAKLTALAALLAQAGAMADRASVACGLCGVKEQDTWLLSPMAAEMMRVLEPVAATSGGAHG